MRRLHGFGYRRRSVRLRVPRLYLVLLRGLMLAAVVVVGVALGAWLAQAGGAAQAPGGISDLKRPLALNAGEPLP